MKIVLFSLATLIILSGIYLFVQFKKFSSVTKGTKIANYDNRNKALLVIDLQKDLTAKDGKAIINLEQTDEVIRHVNTIIKYAKEHDLIVIYIRHEVQPNFIINFITRGVLAEGSVGSEIDSRVNVVNHNIFVKHIMDSFSNTEFEKFLCNKEVDHVILTGVDAQACVDRTLKGALNRGYKVTVIGDAIATKDDARLREKLHEFKEIGATITTTENMLTQDFQPQSSKYEDIHDM
jgi:nicotinamidase-related amidase